eukprot:2167174-Rhodomonas_salina.1
MLLPGGPGSRDSPPTVPRACYAVHGTDSAVPQPVSSWRVHEGGGRNRSDRGGGRGRGRGRGRGSGIGRRRRGKRRRRRVENGGFGVHGCAGEFGRSDGGDRTGGRYEAYTPRRRLGVPATGQEGRLEIRRAKAAAGGRVQADFVSFMRWYPVYLCRCYAMSGPDMAYGATRSQGRRGVAVARNRILGRIPYRPTQSLRDVRY